MILVAGGTGLLGTRVVRLLVVAGERVRVLTRDTERARELLQGVEIVGGDIRSPSDVAAAVRGCSAVVSAVHGFVGPRGVSPESIDRDGNRALIRAARAAGVTRFVLVSVSGASAVHPMSLHRAKFAAEEELRASGMPFTIVRPTAFLETWINVIGGPLARGGPALVFGPGQNPINFVSVRDVAPLVALAARGGVYSEVVEIGGPESLPFVTLAERLAARAGESGKIRHLPLPMLRAMAIVARPFSPAFARQARAAVVMNTIDMATVARDTPRPFGVPTTTLDELLAEGAAATG